MGYARIRITGELLREVFHLPVDTEILGSRECVNDVEIVVSHPDLPVAPFADGEQPPLVTPTFRRQEPVIFEGWGAPHM